MTGANTSGGGSGGSSGAAARGVWELAKITLVALVLAYVLRVLVAEPFHIPSPSMTPALMEGDYIFAAKPAYGYSRVSFAPIALPAGLTGRFPAIAPKRGDIIVFKNRRDSGLDYVKRVIGLPGERVQLIEGVVHVNGAALVREHLDVLAGYDSDGRPVRKVRIREWTSPDRAYVTTHLIDPATERARGFDTTAVYAVPEDSVFVLGDNRDESIDSRFPRVGFVPTSDIVGRADRVILSAQPGFRLHDPRTWSQLRTARTFSVIDSSS